MQRLFCVYICKLYSPALYAVECIYHSVGCLFLCSFLQWCLAIPAIWWARQVSRFSCIVKIEKCADLETWRQWIKLWQQKRIIVDVRLFWIHMFIGIYLEDNIGHEIIILFSDDKRKQYIYTSVRYKEPLCNRWGTTKDVSLLCRTHVVRKIKSTSVQFVPSFHRNLSLTYRFAMIKRIKRTGALQGSELRVRFLCPFPSKIPKRWYSDMPTVSEIIGTGCSCYCAHGVWNLVCAVCICSHLPSPPQKEKRHKVKMPCASVLKCQCLTSVVDVWKGDFDMTEICFL